MSSDNRPGANPGESAAAANDPEFTRLVDHNPLWGNPILAALPSHLKQFVVDQRYDSYQPIDHAIWRFVMRQNYNFLKDHAHAAYVDGLTRTGISIEKIPSVMEMNEILGKIGWACVTVDGFIPPAAFMEFQAYRVLVIAADIRQINHIEYTPAPDIIHEAAGHAPIIADPAYAEYLRRIGEIGSKAMSSRKDFELYEAIRHLSIIKELPGTPADKIAKAEADVQYKQDHLGEPSEMALLSRLHWWTVEYGLIGSLDDPKIYGAGRLSSIGESANCLTDRVKKIPYNLDTQNYAFDIVNQQPQLFVTPDFAHLTDVLESFANKMALRTGGKSGLDKAIECRNVSTYVYSSGLQVTAVVAGYELDESRNPILVRTVGPTMLAIDNRELGDDTRGRYRDGIISPVGNLADCGTPIEQISDSELAHLGLTPNADVALKFASGITAHGKFRAPRRKHDRLIILSFQSCRLTRGGKLLHDSGSGPFDLAVGESIVSVFGGAADKEAFEDVSLVPKERTVRAEMSDSDRQLQNLYSRLRKMRESGVKTDLHEIWQEHQKDHAYDWLLAMELLELTAGSNNQNGLADEIRKFLLRRKDENSELVSLINRGLALIK